MHSRPLSAGFRLLLKAPGADTPHFRGASADKPILGLVGHGHGDTDFVAFIEKEAHPAGITSESKDADVPEGLERILNEEEGGTGRET
jgi:hypothetical protein